MYKSPLSPYLGNFCFSYCSIVLGTNKPIRICPLRIFLENSWGPSKKVFVLIARGANEQKILWRAVERIFNLSRSFFNYYHRALLFWTKRKEDNFFISFNFQVTSKGIIMVYKVVKPTDEEQTESFLRCLRRENSTAACILIILNANYRPQHL